MRWLVSKVYCNADIASCVTQILRHASRRYCVMRHAHTASCVTRILHHASRTYCIMRHAHTAPCVTRILHLASHAYSVMRHADIKVAHHTSLCFTQHETHVNHRNKLMTFTTTTVTTTYLLHSPRHQPPHHPITHHTCIYLASRQTSQDSHAFYRADRSHSTCLRPIHLCS